MYYDHVSITDLFPSSFYQHVFHVAITRALDRVVHSFHLNVTIMVAISSISSLAASLVVFNAAGEKKEAANKANPAKVVQVANATAGSLGGGNDRHTGCVHGGENESKKTLNHKR